MLYVILDAKVSDILKLVWSIFLLLFSMKLMEKRIGITAICENAVHLQVVYRSVPVPLFQINLQLWQFAK